MDSIGRMSRRVFQFRAKRNKEVKLVLTKLQKDMIRLALQTRAHVLIDMAMKSGNETLAKQMLETSTNNINLSTMLNGEITCIEFVDE
jgi:hypothetical protein